MFPLDVGPGGNLYLKATYNALADAIVPVTPWLANEAGAAYLAGGAEWDVGQLLISMLDQLRPADGGLPLATALLLDTGANWLIATGQATAPLNPCAFPAGGPFAQLCREDRIRVLALLEQLALDPATLPPPYRDAPWLVPVTVDGLNRAAVMGFYSEWPGYGTTRPLPQQERELQFFPPGWCQARYPGTSKGYRALRGYLLKEFTE